MTDLEDGNEARYPIDRDGPVAPWRQMADHLLSRIEAGEFPDGKLPRRKDLATQYDVTTTCVTDALAELRDAGVVYATPGQGTFVVPPGEVYERHRNRKDPRPAIDLSASSLIGRNEISDVIKRVLTYGDTVMGLLRDINQDVAETAHFAKTALRRLSALEHAVAQNSQAAKQNPGNTPTEPSDQPRSE